MINVDIDLTISDEIEEQITVMSDRDSKPPTSDLPVEKMNLKSRCQKSNNQ